MADQLLFYTKLDNKYKINLTYKYIHSTQKSNLIVF